jgi:glycosyltransferase involved in cell wall biosynthesis
VRANLEKSYTDGKKDVIVPLSARPLVSIVTTNLNYGEFLEDTILSVLRQDYEHVELVIVDGASTDNSLGIIRKYAEDPRVRWVSEPDKGHMDAVNKGVAMARGEVLGIQHSTDTYQPGAIRAAVNEFQADPLLAFVGGRTQTIDEHGFAVDDPDQSEFDRSEMTMDDIVGFVNYPGIQGSFFRRTLLLAIGGFVHSCHTNTYLHYFLEAAQIGRRAMRVPALWGNSRTHPHHAHVTHQMFKGLHYADQRKAACRENEERYRAFLSAGQIRSLRRAGYEYELRARVRRLHQIVRILPPMVTYLRSGGSFLWVMGQYRALAKRALSRLARGKAKKRLRQGPNTRWFLPAQQERNLLGYR